jgi:hypothetical protein
MVASLASGQELQTSALLSRILSHGGTVRTVRRRRKSLEGFYIDAMKGSGAVDAHDGEGAAR